MQNFSLSLPWLLFQCFVIFWKSCRNPEAFLRKPLMNCLDRVNSFNAMENCRRNDFLLDLQVLMEINIFMCGKVKSITVSSLIWIDPPEIVSFPSPQQDLYEGSGTVLFCNVTGNPQPNISWTKQGNDSVLSTLQTLKLTVLKRVDSGAVYKCKVQNYLGLMETTVMISVLCK